MICPLDFDQCLCFTFVKQNDKKSHRQWVRGQWRAFEGKNDTTFHLIIFMSKTLIARHVILKDMVSVAQVSKCFDCTVE